MVNSNLRIFTRLDGDTLELRRVVEIAEKLHDHLSSAETIEKILKANLHGKPSHGVQACILDYAKGLGFESEKKGLFGRYKTANIRPDYYLSLAEGRGIILEVERGKTLANNMDLLDVWKCHICEEAQYLFLMVPILRPDEKGHMTKVFEKVVERLESFFVKENYINVNGLFIFGY